MPKTLLEVRDLHTYFLTKEGTVKAVNGVSLTLEEDSVLGLVGESGSGKTVTALSILQLVPFPGKIVEGSITYNGENLLGMSTERLRALRGQEISLIFQDSGAALNPVIPIGRQVEEIMLEHTDMGKRQARATAEDLLRQMGIPDARRMLDQYPFQLSGGMAQRVMMAIGVALNPRVLIADEPTSNLDVTLQAEMLQRLRRLRQENHSAIMLITHDLGVIAQMAERVVVMYGGTVVEQATTRDLFARPVSPLHVGVVSGAAQARRATALAHAYAGRAAADDGPAGPVPLPAPLLEGHRRVPHQPAAAPGRGRRQPLGGLLQHHQLQLAPLGHPNVPSPSQGEEPALSLPKG